MARTPSVASARPQRASLGKRDRLAIKNKEDGFVYRIVNDVDDRVDQLKSIGYEVCTVEQVGAIGNKRVDNTSSLGSAAHFSVGQGTKAVVMRIPEDWYKEDQRTKQEEIDSVEATMKKDARKAADYGRLETS
jgi:hypothetical protein